MKELFLKKKRLLLKYVVCFGLFLVVLLSRKMVTTPLLIWSILFFIIFVPGFSLARIFKQKASEISGNLVLWLGLGWFYSLALAIFAIIFSLTINLLMVVFLILTAIILILAFVLEFRRPIEPELPFNWRNWLKWENLPLVLLFVYLSSTIVIINLSGSWYGGGDIQYHFGILRKTIGTQPLSVANLSYVKDQVNVAYVFPVWHVLMGLITKLGSSDMFLVWREMAAPLLMMVYMVWYWLLRKIMPTKNLAILGMFIFTAFSFNWDIGYVFKTLPIPHSLTQFLFLPLLVVLALDFIFKPKINWVQLVWVTALSVLVGAVHLTGYFYFLTIMIGFLLVYSILCFKDQNFKERLQKILLITFSSILLLLPFAIFMEMKTHTLSANFNSFGGPYYSTAITRYTSFADLGILSGLAFCTLPIVFIFARKHRQFILILAVLLLLPLTYNPVVSRFLIHYLGFIFTKRLYGSVVWYFLVWPVVLGFLVLLVDRLISLLKAKWRLYFNILVGTFTLCFIWLSLRFKIAENVYEFLLSDQTNNWLIAHCLWVFIPLLALGIILYFCQVRSKRISDYLTFSEPKNMGWAIFTLVFIGLVFIFPSQKQIFNAFCLKNVQKMIRLSTSSTEKSAVTHAGGKETVAFIRDNIPANVVFSTRSGFFYLPQVVSVHMTGDSSSADIDYNNLYTNDKWPIGQKIKILQAKQIDYLLVVANKERTLKEIQQVLGANPEVFEQIFQAKENFAAIYKVHR